MKKLNKLTMALVLGAFPLLHANAAGVVQVGANLYVPTYTQQEMVAAGCDSNNWNTLVNNYVAKRTNERVVEKAQTDQYSANAPVAQGSSSGGNNACYQAAVGTINGVISQVNSIKNLLSGNGSLTAMAANLANQYANAACQQAVYAVGSRVNQATGAVTGSIYGGQNAVTGGLQNVINGTGITGVNAGSVINSGYSTNNNSSNNIPYVSTGDVSNTINSATGTNLFSRMNPFRSSDTQSVPESLK